ncbi:uncharacterized protein LOC120440328 isoform X1 [Oreochromis aureus]|uniref:uncharacterized protein LOC120440328 isoform X1 n=1 Tax=Oreochromis aureus TaxID=47969 RepID=UPI0019537C06|nr:uncharacterized protein LOC120440328 isoform X1 [Oreochromis aureus]
MAKHLGNLTYNIWNKMKGVVFYAPGTPNAAHPECSVSKDLTSERHQLPDKPERFWILSTHDASKVRASGPGLTSSVSATFPAEFNIDAKDGGQGQLSVLITVCIRHTYIHTLKQISHFNFCSFLFRTRGVNITRPTSMTTVTVHTGYHTSPTVQAGTPSLLNMEVMTSQHHPTESMPHQLVLPAGAP